jgi:hypothetical protein
MRASRRTGAAAGPPGRAARSAGAAHRRATTVGCGQSAAPPAHGLVRPAAPPASERSSGGPVFLHDGGARWCPGAFGVLQSELGGARGRRLFLARGGSSGPPLPPQAPAPLRTGTARGPGARARPPPPGVTAQGPAPGSTKDGGSAGDGPGSRRDGPSAPTARLLGRGTPPCPRRAEPQRRHGQERSPVRRLVAEAGPAQRTVTASAGRHRGTPDRHRPGCPSGRRTTSAPLRPAAAASARSRLSARRSPA